MNIHQLETVSQIIFKHLKKHDVTMCFPIDYYLHIDIENKFNVTEDYQVDIGSLDHDIFFLNRILDNEENLTFLDVERLGNILIAISHVMYKKKV